MNKFDNPFHDLWLTEILNPDEFVRMFSPKIVEFAEDLFGTGNVVVRGRQGSGKSMLLRLLDTSTRIAYARSKERYPVLEKNQFICGSVNLTKSNVSAISSRLPLKPERGDKEWAATTFSDYLNLLLALDLLRNVVELGSDQEGEKTLQSILKVNLTESAQELFCEALNLDGSWYGIFSSCRNLADVAMCIRKRLEHYRSYFNFNVDELNESVSKTRTEVGEPISVLAEGLKSSGIIPTSCLVYLKIDQHEELFELERQTGLGDVFRQTINKALAGRDRRVAYRIGTRHYSWSRDLKIWGTAAHLEDLRDYSVVDIDKMFRRPEDPKIGNIAFKKFAADVFCRRLSVAGFKLAEGSTNLVKDVFGPTPSVRQRARELISKSTPRRYEYPSEWAKEWRDLLSDLRHTDPLDAKLGEAWLMQRAQIRLGVHLDGSNAVATRWREKPWWTKERNEVALIQLASEFSQNLSWYGERHIIDLSGWNILAFMSICRTIWSGWLRIQSSESLEAISLPRIDRSTQIVGIFEASKLWVDKLREGLDGDNRRNFILKLGDWFSRGLRQDKAMSNPGHNGFSMRLYEFEKDDRINILIKRCRDHGDLIESDHTSKGRDGKRKKWYLNPILCPYFRIPHVRTKEPIYAKLDILRGVLSGFPKSKARDEGRNLELF